MITSEQSDEILRLAGAYSEQCIALERAPIDKIADSIRARSNAYQRFCDYVIRLEQ